MKAIYHRKHKMFDSPTVCINKVYYFPEDLMPSTKREGKPFEIQGCYYDGKWRQDTFYITQETRDLILSAMPKRKSTTVMNNVTRVQELENLKEEALARIRAVLDLRGSDYELIPPLDDEPTEEDVENILRCPSFIPHHPSMALGGDIRMITPVYAIALANDTVAKGRIIIDTCDMLGENEEGFYLDKADIPCLLAIADRIDELEGTGIHDPEIWMPNQIVRERDTFDPS